MKAEGDKKIAEVKEKLEELAGSIAGHPQKNLDTKSKASFTPC